MIGSIQRGCVGWRKALGGRASFSSVVSSYKEEPGLFGLPGLNRPSDWSRIAADCIHHCENILGRFRAIQSVNPTVLQHFDDLSDALCRVLDSAELCRNVHPDPAFSAAANEAFSTVSEYMQELNANVDLYDSLVKLEDSKIDLSEEERIMCLSLRRDFERGGIHLPVTKRQRAVELQNEMHNLGAKFNSNIQSSGMRTLRVDADRLKPLPKSFLQYIRQTPGRNGMVELPLSPKIVSTALKWVADPEIRRQVYAASTCAPNEAVLQRLLSVRHEIANLLNFDNYLTLSLVDRVSTSPDSVRRFLQSLADQVSEKAREELSILQAVKTRQEGTEAAKSIYPWDRSYYMAQVKKSNATSDGSNLCEYFPLTACVNGLSMLMKELFGIDLVTCKASEREIWHPDVTKVEMRHEKEGILGHIYLDLFPRAGKYNHAAHFSIRFGRDAGPGEKYQTPAVALVCNLSYSDRSMPTLLTHGDVETLFHEFGHAAHSLLSRTRFQNLSGTRGAVDFVEIPSHLFEHFVWDHRVLSRFAKSIYTGKAVTKTQIDAVRRGHQQFGAMDIQQQIMLSTLDLEFHAKPCGEDWKNVYAAIQHKFTSISPDLSGTGHTTFGHVVGYGAGYYSYLYAKVLAAEIWQSLFKDSPLSRGSGDRLRSNFLAYGGSRDPRKLIQALVGSNLSLLSYMREAGVVDVSDQDAEKERSKYPFNF